MTDRIITSQCDDELIDKFTKELLRQAIHSVTTKGVFNLVLSDSDTLDSIYARLMYDPDMRVMPWKDTHLWFIRNKEDSIVFHSGIPEENVHDGDFDEKVDCCVLSCNDFADISEDLRESCKAFLILSSIDIPTDLSYNGVLHWFYQN